MTTKTTYNLTCDKCGASTSVYEEGYLPTDWAVATMPWTIYPHLKHADTQHLCPDCWLEYREWRYQAPPSPYTTSG